MADTHALVASGLAKTFTMHLRDGLELSVIAGAGFVLAPGRCTVLGGPSGAGKSSILKMLYGNYAASAGSIIVRHRGNDVDVASADARKILEIRRETIGYVSQFLRSMPRVGALDVVIEPLLRRGVDRETCALRGAVLLQRLNVPERLWMLPPATFSGGEQQRINIARGFITDHPILLLDEPTASLDGANREVVIALIAEKKAAGVALLGIFHDADVRAAVADAVIDVSGFAPGREAA